MKSCFAFARLILIAWATIAWSAPHENQAEDAAKAVPSLAEIRKLPIGIEVTHNPHPVRAMEKGRSGMAYTWLYETQVKAIEQPLKIIEFGAFVRQGNRWVFANYTGKPFTLENFADWYHCKDGILNLEETYADPLNWSGSNRLRESISVWYFIAENTEGERYYGEALINELDELIEPEKPL
ncbi:MAG: hypothetical protein AAGJ38_07510 [Planctomycetota bacterium]